ncbi:right-handed parallel beta-helix repeat-containing protein [Tautonia marina]|uniref:right-handed parallel beta-helix repeat-containing protein n=1 Tax=Tautonia marina TaxID=2653855 RepID=UPI0012613B0E|nr:right-handed parallel beta-helix repeat-containing protein [Tautonia marina]
MSRSTRTSFRAIRHRESRRSLIGRRQLVVEVMEPRQLLATFTVLNTADDGPGSFRQAILDANTSLDPIDEIEFDVSGTIELASALPSIDGELIVDATTAPGYVDAPVVVIDGINAGPGVNGLHLAAGSNASVIRGLDLRRFSGAGILVESSDNVIVNNRLGTDSTGEQDLGNQGGGVVFEGVAASNNTLGGTVAADANVIAWNGVGVRVSEATGVAILANSIFQNAGLGIELVNGGNNDQPAPSLTSVDSIDQTTIRVNGTLSGAASNTVFLVQVFASDGDAVDAEGRQFLGEFNVTTNGVGEVTFGTLVNADLSTLVGTAITATASRVDGPGRETSEFSNAVQLQGFVVTTTNDSGFGSLRQVILNANATPGPDEITFAVNGTISLLTPLPIITDTVTIDGWSAPGWDGRPVVELDGGNEVEVGLEVASTAAASSILGLSVIRFTDVGILVNGASDVSIAGNYLGLDVEGISAGNGVGLRLLDATTALVGGLGPILGNLISGNLAVGVEIRGTGATENLLIGNGIGTDLSGEVDPGNGAAGVLIAAGASNNRVDLDNTIAASDLGIWISGIGTIGNLVTETLIYGALGAGVRIDEGATENTVGANTEILGNGIGVLISGVGTNSNLVSETFIAGNFGDGVRIHDGASFNTIGSGNTIQENWDRGVAISDFGTIGNAVLNNLITENFDGVVITDGASANRVEGGNVISDNVGIGVWVSGTDTSGNFVRGNTIDRSGGAGIRVAEGATGNEIGGSPTSGNLVRSGAGDGIVIEGPGAIDNPVIGNEVAGNSGAGIAIRSNAEGVIEDNFVFDNGVGVAIFEASNAYVSRNTIVDQRLHDGSSYLGDGVWLQNAQAIELVENTISGNEGVGVRIETSSNNSLRDNRIGTSASGTSVRGNEGSGVVIDSGQGNRLESNVISGNRAQGVEILGALSSGNLLVGNWIGTDGNGVLILPNLRSGVLIQNAPSNTVGGSANTVAYNFGDGIRVEGPGATGSLIQNNILFRNIGSGVAVVDVDAEEPVESVVVRNNQAIGNLRDGVQLSQSSGHEIRDNLIRANRRDGIHAEGSSRLRIADNRVVGFEEFAPGQPGFDSPVQRFGIAISGEATESNDGEASNVLVVGNTVEGSLSHGILFVHVSQSIVGGTDDSTRNVVHENLGSGIVVQYGEEVQILGNRIGLVPSQTGEGQGNGGFGILLEGTRNAIVGGIASGSANIVVGHGRDGIAIRSQSVDVQVLFNEVGQVVEDTEGLLLNLGNRGHGISVAGQSEGSLIRGNRIVANRGSGVLIDQASRTSVFGNLIGRTALDELPELGNQGDGVALRGASQNAIGGASDAFFNNRNLISGNFGAGVSLRSGSSNNLVLNNAIGTDVSGSRGIGNAGAGVLVEGSPGNQIGTPGLGNVISANGGAGVQVLNVQPNRGTQGVVIQANLIGTDGAGNAPLGNVGTGIFVLDSSGTQIGGASRSAGNVIGANGGSGIEVFDRPENELPAWENVILSNRIGIGNDGTTILGNRSNGIALNRASGSVVGQAEAGNLIAGSGDFGVLVGGGTENTIQGNLVGTLDELQGQAANTLGGITLFQSSGSLVGGLDDGERNLVVGNGSHGIFVIGSGPRADDSVRVYGNLVARNADDGIRYVEAAIPGGSRVGLASNEVLNNRGSGIVLSNLTSPEGDPEAGLRILHNRSIGNDGNGVEVTNSPRIRLVDNEVEQNGDSGILVVGSADVELRWNRIQRSRAFGVLTLNAPGIQVIDSRVSENAESGILLNRSSNAVVQGNLIVRNGLPTRADGIRVVESSGGRLGGSSPGQGNTIIGQSAGAGIRVVNADQEVGSSETLIQGNRIGYLGLMPNEANRTGIVLENASRVVVGGTVGAGGNTISGNTTSGIEVLQTLGNLSPSGVRITGNYLGTNLTGTALPSFNGVNLVQQDGVVLTNAVGVTVGGADYAERNVISGNTRTGVRINGAQTRELLVVGNVIGGADNPTLTAISQIQTEIDAPPATQIRPLVGVDGQPIDPVAFTSITLINGRFIFAPDQPEVQDVGVLIDRTTGNRVFGNAVAYNGVGVQLEETPSAESLLSPSPYVPNRLQGNVVFRNINGVYLANAAGNEIGASPAPVGQRGPGNRIERNISTGVTVFGGRSIGNFVTGNQIRAIPPEDFRPENPNLPRDIGSGIFIDSVVITVSPTELVQEQEALTNLLQGGPGTPGRQFIQRNYIGLGPTATSGLGNLIVGTVFAPVPGQGQPRTTVAGVYLFGGSVGNVIEANRITDPRYGVLLLDSPRNLDQVARQGPNANIIQAREGDVVVLQQRTVTNPGRRNRPGQPIPQPVPGGPLALASDRR